LANESDELGNWRREFEKSMFKGGTCLDWLIDSTNRKCWVHSARPGEWEAGHRRGFTGTTTNPILVCQALSEKGGAAGTGMERPKTRPSDEEKLPEEFRRIVAEHATAVRRKVYEDTGARAGKTPGKWFAVIMIGRVNDCLRSVTSDNRTAVSECGIDSAGGAIGKHAYRIYQGYEAD
jgi:hypothetical protein